MKSLNAKMTTASSNFFIALGILLFSFQTLGQSLIYPETLKEEKKDTLFNRVVSDEYRWLEELGSSRLNIWIEQQNKLAKKELKKASSKFNSFVLIDKYAYVRYENPRKEGEHYFTYSFYDNINAPALFVQSSYRDHPELLIDPTGISKTDNITIKNYEASFDSKYLAYEFSRNGSDWGEIKVVNVKNGIHKSDHLKNVKFSQIAWKGDGFYYSVFPNQGISRTLGQQVYYHILGTDQADDQLIFQRENKRNAYFNFLVTSDERFFILNEVDEVNNILNVFYMDFRSERPALMPLLTKLSGNNSVIILDSRGDELIAKTSKSLNNEIIVKINPNNPRQWKELIPEIQGAVLKEVKLFENRILALYQSNGKQRVVFYDYDGKFVDAINVPFGFSVSGFSGEKKDKKILFSYEGYTQPKAVYILDIESMEMNPLRATVVNFDYNKFETTEVIYDSFDKTKVSLTLVARKGLDLKGNHPVLLKTYGGFGLIEDARFDPGLVHFIEQGGVFAFAHIRGGGDNGLEWEIEGRGLNKMNSFRDFISAAEYLIQEGYTAADKLAITGASNGGLVVSVAMTQRPDLFKAVVPIAAPLDMLRFDKFTVGHFHKDEYGDIDHERGFESLLNYSPLYNIQEEVNYPATLIMASEYDDRVPPLHSYKFAAKLQNRSAQQNPILLRVEEDAGHNGATRSITDKIKEEADMYDFILYHIMPK